MIALSIATIYVANQEGLSGTELTDLANIELGKLIWIYNWRKECQRYLQLWLYKLLHQEELKLSIFLHYLVVWFNML